MRERRFREVHKNEAKKNLQDYALSRCKTILIAGLEQFENGFGFLWGHGKPWAALTEDQKEMREIWKEIRLEILGSGEFRINQLRDKFRFYNIENKVENTFILPQEEE